MSGVSRFTGIPCTGCKSPTARGGMCTLCRGHVDRLRSGIAWCVRDPGLLPLVLAAVQRIDEPPTSAVSRLSSMLRREADHNGAAPARKAPRSEHRHTGPLTASQAKQHVKNICAALRRLARCPGLESSVQHVCASLPREAVPVFTAVWGRLAAPRR